MNNAACDRYKSYNPIFELQVSERARGQEGERKSGRRTEEERADGREVEGSRDREGENPGGEGGAEVRE